MASLESGFTVCIWQIKLFSFYIIFQKDPLDILQTFCPTVECRLSTIHFNKSPPPSSAFKDCFKKLILSCCLGDFIIVYKSWEVISKNGFQKYFSNNIPRKATVKTIFYFQPKYILRLFLSDNCDHPYRSWKTRAELNPFPQSHK